MGKPSACKIRHRCCRDLRHCCHMAVGSSTKMTTARVSGYFLLLQTGAWSASGSSPSFQGGLHVCSAWLWPCSYPLRRYAAMTCNLICA